MKREILTWTDSNKEVICKKEEPENGVYEYTYEIPESEKEETLHAEALCHLVVRPQLRHNL